MAVILLQSVLYRTGLRQTATLIEVQLMGHESAA
jgi:hypothetical protein